MSVSRRVTWRQLKPGELVHKVAGCGIGACGITERQGARFAATFRCTTCPKCREVVLRRRAEAKARFAARE